MIVLVATTEAYVAPTDNAVHTIVLGGGTQTVHAGSRNQMSAVADAGNVKFAPGAPTFSAPSTTGGSLAGGTTLYYRIRRDPPER